MFVILLAIVMVTLVMWIPAHTAFGSVYSQSHAFLDGSKLSVDYYCALVELSSYCEKMKIRCIYIYIYIYIYTGTTSSIDGVLPNDANSVLSLLRSMRSMVGR